MSMLTAQADELREKARLYEGYQNGEISRLLSEAADTILYLRELALAATLGYELNPDELPVGLTISDDGALLNWRGENYVRQGIAATLGTPAIVRCRDCEWFTSEYWYEEERGFGLTETICEPSDCGNPIRCATTWDSLTKKFVPIHITTEPDGFCAWAKRKGGGDEA